MTKTQDKLSEKFEQTLTVKLISTNVYLMRSKKTLLPFGFLGLCKDSKDARKVMNETSNPFPVKLPFYCINMRKLKNGYFEILQYNDEIDEFVKFGETENLNDTEDFNSTPQPTITVEEDTVPKSTVKTTPVKATPAKAKATEPKVAPAKPVETTTIIKEPSQWDAVYKEGKWVAPTGRTRFYINVAPRAYQAVFGKNTPCKIWVEDGVVSSQTSVGNVNLDFVTYLQNKYAVTTPTK